MNLFILIFFIFLKNNSWAVEVKSLDRKDVQFVTEEDEKSFQKKREEILSDAETKIEPTRDFSIIVTAEGYYPSHISLFQGEKVRFFITNLTDEPACMIVSHHNVFLAAEKGKITEGETHFNEPGTFPFYCPSTKHNGKISVIEKKKKVVERKIASESAPIVEGPWIPREK
jgi:plastocyanin